MASLGVPMTVDLSRPLVAPTFHSVPLSVPNFRNDRSYDPSNNNYLSENQVDPQQGYPESNFDYRYGSLDRISDTQTANGDDGVVLLVGLFNLLAIVVYSAQLVLLKRPLRGEDRVINWQVQKVLDELVLRVHSSATTSNMLARSLNLDSYPFPFGRASYGRNLGRNKITESLKQHLKEDDPVKLKNWLHSIVEDLLKTVASSEDIKRGPKIDPKMYVPLLKFYLRLMQTNRQGRAFERSLVKEIGSLAVVASELNLSEIQEILKTVTKLGRAQRYFDIQPLLKALLANSLKQDANFVASPVVRMKRETTVKRVDKRNKPDRRIVSSSSVLSGSGRRYPSTSTYANWADGGFFLMTQAAPLGLDITTLYTTAQHNPRCLQGQLCAANHFWKQQGPFHASLTPLLSVVLSWALESSNERSLGDSLIAIRAGWMGKDCRTLYPECLVTNGPHPIAREATDLLSKKPEPAEPPHYHIQSRESEKTATSLDQSIQESVQDPLLTPADLTKESSKPEETQVDRTDLPAQTSQDSSQRTKDDNQVEDKENVLQGVDSPSESYPYERYDTPVHEGEELQVPSGSVAGMDIQDPRNPYPSKSELGQVISIPIYKTQDVQQSQIYQMTPGMTYMSKDKRIREYPPSNFHQLRPYSSIKRSEQPHTGNIPGYSSYMALQRPASLNDPLNDNENRPESRESDPMYPTDQMTGNTQRRPIFTIKNKGQKQVVYGKMKKDTNKKYRYGLRRGLPASNVNGYSPLMDSANEIRRRGQASQRGRTQYSRQNPLPKKPVTKFQPTDAITDVFRNKMLYQYIRDRHMRRLPV